jgi:hypothetical protein
VSELVTCGSGREKNLAFVFALYQKMETLEEGTGVGWRTGGKGDTKKQFFA